MDQVFEDNVNHLLDSVTHIIKEFEETWQETGEKFNIFKITRFENDEVKTCKVLAALLDPNGFHGMGSHYLDLFVKMIHKKTKKDKVYKIDVITAKVSTNYHTFEGRFFDIVIETNNIFVPIEVKINADDLQDQVADYAEVSKTRNNGVLVPVLYITKYGDKPGEKSTQNEEDYECLSFKNDIVSWLEDCEKKTKEHLPAKGIIAQLINAIKYFCGESEDKKMENEIVKIITKDDKTFRIAQAISGAMNFDKRVREVFNERITALVKEKYHNAGVDYIKNEDYIQLEFDGGNYILDVYYDWRSLYIEIGADENDRNPEFEKSMNRKMEEFTNLKSEKTIGKDVFVLEGTNRYPFEEAVDDDLYFYKLWKLYTEQPEIVAEKIIEMVKELEKVKG